MLKRLVGIAFLIIIAVSAVLYFFGADILKRKLKNELYSHMNINFEYNTIILSSINPLEIIITDITLKKRKEFDLSIKSIRTELNIIEIISNWSNKSIRSVLVVDNLKSNIKLSTTTKPATIDSSGIATPSNIGSFDLKEYFKSNFGIMHLDFTFKITKFDNTIYATDGNYRFTGSDTLFKITGLDKPILLNLNALIYSQNTFGPLSGIYVPIKTTSQFVINHGVFKLLKSDTSIADVKSTLQAQIILNNLDFDSSIKIHTPQIEAISFLKRYQNQFPFTDQAGAMTLDIGAKGNIKSIADVQLKGHLVVKSFSAHMKYKTPDLSLQGPLKLDLNSTFTYFNKTPAIMATSWKLNLDKSELAYKNIFHKDNSIRLQTEGTASYSSDITIDQFRLWFHTMDISIKGMASQLRSSDLSVSLKPLKLQDFKKFLPNNKDFDISGDLELEALVKGFLNQPKYLTVDVKKIKANNVKYYLDFKNDLFSANGPLYFTLLGHLLYERAQVLSGSIKGFGDLTQLKVSHRNQVRKNKSDLFKAAWTIQAKDGRLNIEKLLLNTYLTNLTVKGLPPLSQEDQFNLTIDLASLNWPLIKPMLPKNEWLDTIADMKNKGTITAKGKLDPFQPLESQLEINSNLQTDITSLDLPFNFHFSKQPPVNQDEIPVALTTPDAFIQNTDLLRRVRWNHKVSINKLTFKNSSSFHNVNLAADLANNNIRVSGDIKYIFNGRLAFSEVSIPLTQPDPIITYKLNSSNISFSPLVEFIMPEYKEIIDGVANFEVAGQTKIPGTLNFKKDLIAKGQFRIPESKIYMLKLLNEIKQRFSPGKSQNVSINNLSASTEAEFEVKDSNITIAYFKSKAPNNDEIELNGQIGFDLDSQIKALLKLVSLPVHGDFLAANQNAAGQIEIPITIEGNLMQPKWSFVGNTFEKMTQTFVDYQKNKAKILIDRKIAAAKVQAQAEIDKRKKEVQNEIEFKKKELSEEAKKKLGELFK